MATKPQLTREALHQTLVPPNNCAVKRFRDALDEASRAVLDEAIAYKSSDFPANKIIDFLKASGFPEDDIPGTDAFKDHRSGRRPCRCRG